MWAQAGTLMPIFAQPLPPCAQSHKGEGGLGFQKAAPTLPGGRGILIWTLPCTPTLPPLSAAV